MENNNEEFSEKYKKAAIDRYNELDADLKELKSAFEKYIRKWGRYVIQFDIGHHPGAGWLFRTVEITGDALRDNLPINEFQYPFTTDFKGTEQDLQERIGLIKNAGKEYRAKNPNDKTSYVSIPQFNHVKNIWEFQNITIHFHDEEFTKNTIQSVLISDSDKKYAIII